MSRFWRSRHRPLSPTEAANVRAVDREFGEWCTRVAEQKAVVARHEASHCVVALALGLTAHELGIQVHPSGAVTGRFLPSPRTRTDTTPEEDTARAEQLSRGLKPADIFGALVTNLAPFALEIANASDGALARCQHDITLATTLARATTASERVASRLIDHALLRAARIVDQNRTAIFALADELNRKGTLNADEIAAALGRSGFVATRESDGRCDYLVTATILDGLRTRGSRRAA